MIRYALRCGGGHRFEAWFPSSDAYDEQAARGLVSCPICDTPDVSKAIMAPAVVGAKRSVAPDAPAPAQMREMFRKAAREVRRKVIDEFDHVGDAFAKEARAIHEGAAEERGIYGEASAAEVRALKEDGIGVSPLPPEPPEEGELN